MKIIYVARKVLPFTAFLILMACQAKMPDNQVISIEDGFKNIPDSMKLWTYWYWMNDFVSKEGISNDLESMAELGIGKAFIGNIGDEKFMPSGNLRILGDEWWELMRWAIIEGNRTGVDIGIFNCPGWSQSGGPWITPDKSTRYLVNSEIRVRGPIKIDTLFYHNYENFQEVTTLAFPAPNGDQSNARDLLKEVNSAPSVKGINNLCDGDLKTETLLPAYNAENTEYSIEINLSEPVLVNSLTIHTAHEQILADCDLFAKINNEFILVRSFQLDRQVESLNVGAVPYAPVVLSIPGITSSNFKFSLRYIKDRRGDILEGGIKEIILSKAAKLEFYMEKQLAKLHQSPVYRGNEYQWKSQAEVSDNSLMIDHENIINLSGYTNEEGVLKWDVPDGEWIIQRIGMIPTGVVNHPTLPHARGLEVDKMSKEAIYYHFDNYLGKILEGVPDSARSAFTNVIIDSYETGAQNWTDDFDRVFKKVYGYDPIPWLPVLSGRIIESAEQSDRFLWDLRRLISDRIATEYVGGLKEISNKNGAELWLENYGHWGFPGESLMYGGQSDNVAGEFWNEGPLGLWECKIASSCGHIYGKNVISAESFTSVGLQYQRSPLSFRKRGDWSYTEGINQTVLTLFIHQPFEDRKPGVNAWFGSEINRHNTWFSLSAPWMEYQRRNNFLLQQGNYVADVCYFIGEDAPKSNGVQVPPLPVGYSFDYINYDVIMNRLDVKDGKFILPDGMSYRIMVLPDSKTMRPELLEKISQLVEKGGIILGTPPVKSPGLKNYPVCDEEVKRLSRSLWGNIDKNPEGSRKYGKGRVFFKLKLDEVFEDIGLNPDFVLIGDANVLFTHRRNEDLEIYFITNQENKEVEFEATFRVIDKEPEWWNPIDGSIRSLPEFESAGEGIKIPVHLNPFESGYIVFRKNAKPESSALNFPEFRIIQEINSPWNVSFTDPFGETFTQTLEELIDWKLSDNERIKYFSGTAVYRSEFYLNNTTGQMPVFLNLGKVKAIANIRINGKVAGGLWTEPWRIDISEFLVDGKNNVEIEVANTWVNRMTGDAKIKRDKRETWLPLNQFKENGPLQSSGLLGPVTLEIFNE